VEPKNGDFDLDLFYAYIYLRFV